MRRLPLLALGAYAIALAVLLHVDFADRNLVLLLVTTVLFGVAVLASARSGRVSSASVIGVGALFQLIALTRPPVGSDDAYRYAWDAKVQFAGIDPYRYVPQSPRLAMLRDGWMFGPSSPCTYRIPGSCTAINRPSVHTIYPPVAQWGFDLGRILSLGGHGQLFVYQLLGAFGATAVAVLLARTGRPVWTVALWSWCPVVVLGFGNDAHIDWLAVLLVVLALTSRRTKHPLRAGILIGAAIATKIYPALVLPALIRGRGYVQTAIAALATVVLVYVPHVLAVGSGVFGYLSGYLDERGYRSGSGLLLLGAVLPHPADVVAAVALLGVAAFLLHRRTDTAHPEQTAVLMTGVAFVVMTPAYGWYATLLVALVVLSRRWEWMFVALASSFAYLLHEHAAQVAVYGVAVLATAAAWLLRVRHRSFEVEPADVVTANTQ